MFWSNLTTFVHTESIRLLIESGVLYEHNMLLSEIANGDENKSTEGRVDIYRSA